MNSSAQPRTAAFFDFDETLLTINSSVIGFKVLKEQGYLTRSFLFKMSMAMLLNKIKVINEQQLIRIFLSFYRGRQLQPFLDSASEFYSMHLQPNLSSQVLAKLKWHQSQEHLTVLVSGSIDYYLKPVIEDLGIEHLLCTKLEVNSSGVLTGRSQGPICMGNEKVALTRSLVADLGIDLSRSYAYGNSELDIPLLGLVGYPVVVNPSARLSEYAHAHNWPEL